MFNFNITNISKVNLKDYLFFCVQIIKEVKQKLNIIYDFELNLIFNSIEKQIKFNKKYRNKNYAADVLSFRLEEQGFNFSQIEEIKNLGDIYICVDVIKSDLVSIKNINQLDYQILFLFLHGFLHLLGYDHYYKNEKLEMFKIQDDVLKAINIKKDIFI